MEIEEKKEQLKAMIKKDFENTKIKIAFDKEIEWFDEERKAMFVSFTYKKLITCIAFEDDILNKNTVKDTWEYPHKKNILSVLKYK